MKRAAFAISFLLLVCTIATPQKRPLTHADYDGWRHIQNQHLSDDGKWLVYALFPQEGDGEFVARELATGKEYREPIGPLPPPPPPNFAAITEDAPPQQRNVQISFTRDGRMVVFSTFPAKKTKPSDQPKGGMRIMDLTTGTVTRVEKVKSFQVPSKGDGFVAYLLEADKKDTGADLTLRNLATGADRKFPDVVDYTLTKDAKLLTYADGNGVYAVTTAGDSAPKTVLAGKAKYSKMTWDEKQSQMAFFADTKLYLWHDETLEITGLPISNRSTLTFSKDGRELFFGYAPKTAPAPKKEAGLPEDRVSVDLWHWKDDYIQPMQKVRAQADRNRSYRAVYHIADKKVVTLGDPTLAEITAADDGRYSLGGDDRDYRRMIEYDERYSDTYVVDNLTGERKLAVKKHLGRTTWSPDGKTAVFFNGKDWMAISAADGKAIDLTASVGVKFSNEEHDSPSSPQPYGLGGWTKDGKTILLNDRFDIWQVAADGSWAKNITQNRGREERITFRYVRLDEDPEDKGVDPSKPLLLRAENADTHDSGFYRVSLTGKTAPQKLLMGAKNYSNPIKAKNADVMVLTAATFRESPDLHVTDSNFNELKKVSDANPQQAGILWGTAELMHYRNMDGTPLSGILYKPADFDPKKKYPMIVYIYERLSQGLNNYIEPRPGHTINPSYYASNGYLVLEPDIAYKIGYPGQSALNCVLPAVQAIVNQGFVDENAIGIQGHSWGGYQIAYMITQTNRFKAAAPGAVVANMTSAYDGIRWGPGIPRQFQYERTQSRIGGNLWEYPMRYIENSPLFMADRVKTPVMMIHNDADDAVPWYQGIEFYLALRRLGKEAYLFTYNGEPHGLRRRPNQKDYAVRLQQYFDHYLKGAPAPDWMVRGIPYLEKPGVTVEVDQQ